MEVILRTTIIKFKMSKKALLIGVNGQDGAYLSELPLNEGYEVHYKYYKSHYTRWCTTQIAGCFQAECHELECLYSITTGY